MKKSLLLIAILFIAVGFLSAQTESGLSIHASPGAEIPLPLENQVLDFGGGSNFDFEFRLPFLPALSLLLDINYAYLPIITGDATNFFSGGGGLGLTFPRIGGKLRTSLFATGGYYYGIIAEDSGDAGGNLIFTGGTRMEWPISSAYDIGLEVRYKALLDGLGGLLHHGISVGLSNSINIHQKGNIRIFNINFQDVFPVLYKYYDSNSLGKVEIKNSSSGPIKDIEVSVFVEKYMDNPTICPSPKQLRGGEKFEVDLFALFSENVLEITEATVVSANVKVSFTQNNKTQEVSHPVSMRLYDRHAMTWDDDRKAAAFVNFKDPSVIEIGKSIGNLVADRNVVDSNLKTAMALHESFGLAGIKYVIDPTTPFTEYSEDVKSIDFLQFPYNTLRYKSGDCDDLSILYASVLQSVGIETAFITIPGHIYMAFALTLPPDEAKRTFSEPDDVIVMNDEAWIPLEITMVGESFLKAWKVGALQWNENNEQGKAGFFPLSEAWKIFEPVGFSGSESEINFVDQGKIATAYKNEMTKFIEREIYSQTERYKDRIKNKKSAKLLTQLGNVYARYGRTSDARDYYQQALQMQEYFPAYLNIGNLYFLDKNYAKALEFYRKAEKLKSQDWLVQLQISRAYNELGNFKNSGEYYDKMKQTNPAIAGHYSYLDLSAGASSRASNKGAADSMMWAE